MLRIRIISCPVGEEPQWVREAWIELEFSLTSLPLIVKQGFPEESGLFITPKGTFPVSFQNAMRQLGIAERFEAVRWWKEKHWEEFCSQDSIILFHESCCEYLP